MSYEHWELIYWHNDMLRVRSEPIYVRMRFMYNDYLQRPDAASSPSKVLALDEAAAAFHRLP